MSAPRADLHHASLLSYGFLAARAEAAAKLLEERKELSAADREALQDAADFLRKISTGADFLTERKLKPQDLMGALDALNIAMDPIKRISSFFSNGKISDIFASTANTVASHVDATSPRSISTQEMENIRIFRAFFDALYVFVTNELEQDTPLVGATRSHSRHV